MGKKVFYFKGYRFNGKPVSQIKLGAFNDGNSGGLTLAQWSTRWLDFKRKQIKSVSDHEGRLKK